MVNALFRSHLCCTAVVGEVVLGDLFDFVDAEAANLIITQRVAVDLQRVARLLVLIVNKVSAAVGVD